MSARTGYSVALAAAVVLYALSRTQQGQAIVTSATESIASGVVGWRLNNPFNIERGEKWQGLSTVQKHERFATFDSMVWGIRAWHKIMQTYRNSYGIKTVAGIIDRFNPVSDGQPSTYIPNVASGVGVNANSVIDIMNKTTAFRLARAMMKVEIGSVAAALVTDADVYEGLRLAGVA